MATREPRIGIRKLKSMLSECMCEVRSCRALMVTQHGKAVARIIPETASTAERLDALRKTGIIAWSGRRLRRIKPVARVHGKRDCGSRERKSRVIACFDAGALVKRYVSEHGSSEKIELSTKVDVVATSSVSRASRWPQRASYDRLPEPQATHRQDSPTRAGTNSRSLVVAWRCSLPRPAVVCSRQVWAPSIPGSLRLSLLAAR
jgi:antitoxin (DNA-binding transcriptional repressor) of toxin-antitoxin stability system